MATTLDRSVMSTRMVMAVPMIHIARAGVFLFGSSLPSACGRCFRFAIA